MPPLILQPAPFRVPLLDPQGQMVEPWKRFFHSVQTLITLMLPGGPIDVLKGGGTHGWTAEDAVGDDWQLLMPGPMGLTGAIGPQGMPGFDGADSDENAILSAPGVMTGIVPAINGGTGQGVYAVGDLLTADTVSTLARLADVAVNSILISKGVGVIPAWSDNVNFGTTGSGLLNISGRLALAFTLIDNGNAAQSINATFPSVITANRQAISYVVNTAGSSAFAQIGLQYTVNAGYTGNSTVTGMVISANVANPNNQTIGIRAQIQGAGLSNCGLSGVVNAGTNGNIGVYGGLGNFTEGNFNFNITAAILASNGATGNDIYRGYSSTTLKFSVNDSGTVTSLNNIAAGAAALHLWTGRSSMSSPADGQINLTKASTTVGIGLDVATDGTLKIRNRAQTAGTGNVDIGALVTAYNGIATVTNGVPSIYGTVDTTGLTANVAAATLYVVPASGAGLYRISAYVVETTAASVSSTLPNVQVVYTDNDTGGSVTLDVTPILGIAGIGQTGALTANTIGTVSSGVVPINVKASTTIQYQTVNYASSLAGMAYALHLRCEAL